MSVFEQARDSVEAVEAARFYVVTFDRLGKKALCPFHGDKHPSMSFSQGRFHCWACNAQGDSVEFVAKLFNEKPIEAVRRLNNDFCLNLPLEGKFTPEQREQARKRKEKKALTERFLRTLEAAQKRLSAVHRELFRISQNPPEMAADRDFTNEYAFAVQWVDYVFYLLDGMEAKNDIRQIYVAIRKASDFDGYFKRNFRNVDGRGA